VHDAWVGSWRHHRTGIYLVAKPSHMRLDVEGLSCPLHRPTVCSHRRGGQSFLTGAIPFCHAAVGGAAFSGDAKPLGLDILCLVHRPNAYKTKSYMEKPASTRVGLSDVRVIMVIMCVPLVESLCQEAIGWIPTLEYLLPGMHGGMWPCSVMPDNKNYCFVRPRRLVKIYLILEASWWRNRMLRPVPGWRWRQVA
jgi:hypothetical protein